MPTRKSYNQNCPIARGLDILGERWTLLILRELVGGARRYGDLRAELPGIATNLLAERRVQPIQAKPRDALQDGQHPLPAHVTEGVDGSPDLGRGWPGVAAERVPCRNTAGLQLG